MSPDVRSFLRRRIAERAGDLVELTAALVRTPSPNPPGDTTEVASLAADWLASIEGAVVSRHTAEAPIVNVVARLGGGRPGRRLAFNGHLDTYPVGSAEGWDADPYSGLVENGRLYGRGVSDMKAGIASSMIALAALAECRGEWGGEAVLTLAGDEETMGVRGTQYLLDTVPEARGDAMISGDAGSPRVLRFGEKGMLWLDVSARGRAAHGAHVHLGRNAIEMLMEALARLAKLGAIEIDAPAETAAAVAAAAPVSESVSGAGESEILGRVTVNIGTVSGGRAHNLVADRADARLDIRIPPGLTVAALEQRVAAALAPLDGVAFTVLRRYEPTVTDPDHEIVRICVDNAAGVLGEPAVANMRIGASDARLYRLAGVPSVVCGLTPHNMGGANEYVLTDEVAAVAVIHALSAFDFLSRDTG